MCTLSVLDYGKFAKGTVPERLEFAHDLVESFKTYGFVKIRNHGIPEEHVRRLFEWIHRFFSLPLERRQEIEMKHDDSPQRGYQSFGLEKTAWLRDFHQDVGFLAGREEDVEKNDEKEFFSIGPPEDVEYPNVWPNESLLPGFREFMEDHFQRCRAFALHIVEATAMGLDVPATALLNRCLPDSSYARCIVYPQSSVQSLSSGKSQRIWPHTDEGVLTLLFQDSVGGLELEDRPNGRIFVPVAPTPEGAPSEIVVNTSDALQRWTNNSIRAGLHQVNLPGGLKDADSGVVPARYSYPFFLGPNFDASIGPLLHFVSDDNPANYEEMKYLEYCNMLIGGNYQNSSPAQMAKEAKL